MILTSVVVPLIFLMEGIFAQVQDPREPKDIKNNPFFDKFFEEFQKQYEELKNSMETSTTSSFVAATPKPNAYISQSNPFLSSQSTIRPTNIRRPSRRPTINPNNPYIGAPSNTIRPTRRPRPQTHINPFFTTTTTTEQPFVPQNEFVAITNEEPTREQQDSPILRIAKKLQDEDGTQTDTKEDFLSFVQSALANQLNGETARSSGEQKTSPQSARNLVKKLINIAPRLRVEDKSGPRQEVLSRPRAEIPSRPTDDIQSRFGVSTGPKKLRPEDKFDEEEFRKQSANAKYSFASDVKDDINGNVHQRQETREGNKVTGMYTSEDGFYRRTVHYEADEKGYRIVKEDIQEIGDGPQFNPDGSAKVKSYVAGRVVDYQITNKDIQRKKPIRYRGIEDPDYDFEQR